MGNCLVKTDKNQDGNNKETGNEDGGGSESYRKVNVKNDPRSVWAATQKTATNQERPSAASASSISVSLESNVSKALGSGADLKQQNGSGADSMNQSGSGADSRKQSGSGADSKKQSGSGADLKKQNGSGADLKKQNGSGADLKKPNGSETDPKIGSGLSLKNREGSGSSQRKPQDSGSSLSKKEKSAEDGEKEDAKKADTNGTDTKEANQAVTTPSFNEKPIEAVNSTAAPTTIWINRIRAAHEPTGGGLKTLGANTSEAKPSASQETPPQSPPAPRPASSAQEAKPQLDKNIACNSSWLPHVTARSNCVTRPQLSQNTQTPVNLDYSGFNNCHCGAPRSSGTTASPYATPNPCASPSPCATARPCPSPGSYAPMQQQTKRDTCCASRQYQNQPVFQPNRTTDAEQFSFMRPQNDPSPFPRRFKLVNPSRSNVQAAGELRGGTISQNILGHEPGFAKVGRFRGSSVGGCSSMGSPFGGGSAVGGSKQGSYKVPSFLKSSSSRLGQPKLGGKNKTKKCPSSLSNATGASTRSKLSSKDKKGKSQKGKRK